MVSLIGKSPSISEAYDTSTHAFREYLEEVIAWFDSQEQDYATIDAEVRASSPAEQVTGFRVALIGGLPEHQGAAFHPAPVAGAGQQDHRYQPCIQGLYQLRPAAHH